MRETHRTLACYYLLRETIMNYTIEGTYKNDVIELIETPKFYSPVKVIVIFLENEKK